MQGPRLATPPMTPMAKRLAVLLLAAFVVELVLNNWAGVPAFEWLALQYGAPGLHTGWQVFTHLFAYPPDPNSVVSVLFALLFLWWMIAPFEARFGARATLGLVLVAALASAGPALAAAAALGAAPGQALHGFGPALMAALAAFAISMRNQVVSLFGVVAMRGIHVLWLALAFSVLMFLANRNLVELVAELGAAGGGVLFVRWIQRSGRPGRRPSAKRSSRPPLRVVGDGETSRDRPRWLN